MPPTDYEAARHIEPVEEVVDDLVATLRANHIRRVRDGQCTVYAGLTFLDILVNVERIARPVLECRRLYALDVR